MKRLEIAPAARADLAGIRSHLSRYSPSAARRLLEELREAIRRIAEFPGIGHSREDLSQEPVLFWPVRSYLVIYEVGHDSVRVLRVLHGAQDLETLLGDAE